MILTLAFFCFRSSILTNRGTTWLLLALAGCPAPAAPPQPPATPPVDEQEAPEPALPAPIAAGKDCVHATARCDVAVCTSEIHNECETPVRCELTVLAKCGSATSAKDARAKASDSFPVDTAGTLEATADCGTAAVAATRAEMLHCR